jgi:hypothetical protein
MFTLNNITKSEDLSSYLVTSHACPMCGDRVTISIAPEKLFAYNQGAYAQEVLSEFDADTREQFITGTCGTCWNSMFDFDDE